MKKTLWDTVAIVAIAATTALSVTTVSAFAAGDAAAGKELFLKKCASCHGQNGEGKEVMAKSLNVKFKHLGSPEVQARSDGDLGKAVTVGIGKMKPIKDIEAKGIEDVVTFVRTLKAGK